MAKAERRAAQRAAYNLGYRDAINARAPAPPEAISSTPSLLFYYNTGHEEGWPLRMVDTYVMTPRGPVRERCTLDRAAVIANAFAKLRAR